MKIYYKICICMAMMILLAGLTGCGSSAPDPNSPEVVEKVIGICCAPGFISADGIDKDKVFLRSVNKIKTKDKMVIACAELVVCYNQKSSPFFYCIFYMAKYTPQGKLYVEVADRK